MVYTNYSRVLWCLVQTWVSVDPTLVDFDGILLYFAGGNWIFTGESVHRLGTDHAYANSKPLQGCNFWETISTERGEISG